MLLSRWTMSIRYCWPFRRRYSLRRTALRRIQERWPRLKRLPERDLSPLERLQGALTRIQRPEQMMAVALVLTFIVPLLAGFFPVLVSIQNWPRAESLAAFALGLGGMLLAVTAFATPWRYRQFREVGLGNSSLLFREGWLPMLAASFGCAGGLLTAQVYETLLPRSVFRAESATTAILFVLACLTGLMIVMLSSFMQTLGRIATVGMRRKELLHSLKQRVLEDLISSEASRVVGDLAQGQELELADPVWIHGSKGQDVLAVVPGDGTVSDCDLRLIGDLASMLRAAKQRDGKSEGLGVAVINEILGTASGGALVSLKGGWPTRTSLHVSHLLRNALTVSSAETTRHPLKKLTERLRIEIRAGNETEAVGLLGLLRDLVEEGVALAKEFRDTDSVEKGPPRATILQGLLADLTDTLRAAIEASEGFSRRFGGAVYGLCCLAIRNRELYVLAHYLKYLPLWYAWRVRTLPEAAEDTGRAIDEWLGSMATWALVGNGSGGQQRYRQRQLHRGFKGVMGRHVLDLIKFAIEARRERDALNFLQRAWGRPWESGHVQAARWEPGNPEDTDLLAILNDMTVIAVAWCVYMYRTRRARSSTESIGPYRDFIVRAADHLEGGNEAFETLWTLGESPDGSTGRSEEWGLWTWRDPDTPLRPYVTETSWGSPTWPIEGALFLAAVKGLAPDESSFLPKRRPEIRESESEKLLRRVDELGNDAVLSELAGLSPEEWGARIQKVRDAVMLLADSQRDTDGKLAREGPLSQPRIHGFASEVVTGLRSVGRISRLFRLLSSPPDDSPSIIDRVTFPRLLDRTEFIEGWHTYLGGVTLFGKELAERENCYACHALCEKAPEGSAAATLGELVTATREAIDSVKQCGAEVCVMLPAEKRFWVILRGAGGTSAPEQGIEGELEALGVFHGATVYYWPHWQPSSIVVFARSAIASSEGDPPVTMDVSETDEVPASDKPAKPVIPLVKCTLVDSTELFILDPDGIHKVPLDPKGLGYAVDLEARRIHTRDCPDCPASPGLWELTLQRCQRDDSGNDRQLRPCRRCRPYQWMRGQPS